MKENPEWKRCKAKCCRTGLGICHNSYRCRCHEPLPEVIAWSDSIEEEGGYTDW